VALVITGIDEKIVRLIPEIRATHHACTARHLAGEMRMHHTHISNRLRLLQAQGVIDFTTMPGSIHLTGTTEVMPVEADADVLWDGELEAEPAPRTVKPRLVPKPK
jgi:hypothetical protein